MKTMLQRLGTALALTLGLGLFTGCESSGGGSSNRSTSMYYGVGLYDPWHYGGYYYPPDVVVPPPRPRPPGGAFPPSATQPIAPAHSGSSASPRVTPSIPSAPRPVARPMGRR
jgi:hypothetical protein